MADDDDINKLLGAPYAKSTTNSSSKRKPDFSYRNGEDEETPLQKKQKPLPPPMQLMTSKNSNSSNSSSNNSVPKNFPSHLIQTSNTNNRNNQNLNLTTNKNINNNTNTNANNLQINNSPQKQTTTTTTTSTSLNNVKESEMPFETLCDFFDRISNEGKKDKTNALLEKLFKKYDVDDYFPLLRLLLPAADKERQSYGMKEKQIGKFYVKIFSISDSSVDAQRLIHWSKPKSGGAEKGGKCEVE